MRQNPHVRICGGPGSATTLVYPTVRHPRPAGRPGRGGGRFEVMPAFDESYKSSMCGGGRVASTSTLVSNSAPTRKNPMTDRVAAAVGYTSRWRISGGGTSHAFDEPASRWRTAATTR